MFVREIQKTKRSVIVLFFYLLLAASLRFSLVYLCVQFVFSAAVLHFLVRWINSKIALRSKGVYRPSLHFFCENNPEPWPIFFFVHWQIMASFSITIMESIRLKVIALVNEGAKVLNICTTWVGLSDLASDGSPLFAEPLFPFGWALCNTSTHCMLTFWLSCVNSALRH